MSLIIAANWKMYKTVSETKDYLDKFTGNTFNKTQVVVCPPFTALSAASEVLCGTQTALGAQNMNWHTEGAYTGEVSPLMLKDLGVRYVIIGHSERRHKMNETNADINQKVLAAVEYSFTPILCVGETGDEREAGRTKEVVLEQLREGLKDVAADKLKNLVVAYEPVWAIGTGLAASAQDAVEVAQLIREELKPFIDSGNTKFRLQYGGSVNKDNIGEYVSAPEINGALVGGASLQADSFAALIRAAEEAVNDEGD